MTDSEKLDRLLEKVQVIDVLCEKVQVLDDDMQSMKSDMQNMKSDMRTVKSDMRTVKADLQTVKTDLTGVDQRLRKVELTLENETNRNIRIIGESCLDLSKKLDEAIRVKAEREYFIVRLNTLENRVDWLEEKETEAV